MAEENSSPRESITAAPADIRSKVLVVDDEEINLKLLRVALKAAGYDVIEAVNGRQALHKVEEAEPDIVLLDVMLPDIDGFAVCERIRSDPKRQGLPVLMLTALKELEDRVKALEVGADDFLSKPFNKVELLARVRSLLRVKNLRDRLEERNAELRTVNMELQTLNRELRGRNQELEQGMEMAHRLQEAFLPQEYPRTEGLSFCHKYSPAEAVGGDYFELIPISESKVGVFVCDVSGHGVRAALVTSVVKTLVEDVMSRNKNPGDVLRLMNIRFQHVMGRMVPQIYFTAFLMILDGKERCLDVSCAGHPSPLHIDKTARTVESIVETEDMSPAIGFLPDLRFKVVHRKINQGDIVMGFTDGLYEVHNPRGEQYGMKRVRDFIKEHIRLIPRELVQKLLSDTESFMQTHKKPDDVCIVTAESM